MEENSELEEGETYCYKDDDDSNIDPDIALSYIDERIQHVLGHFQKDFEGGVSAENLGAKFGGYGSFLPTYERSSTIWSHPKTPHRNSSTTRSPDNFPMEGASQNLKATSNELPSVRPGTASCSAQILHNSGMPSGDVSVKQDSRLSSAKVAEKFTLKDESSNKSGNTTDQRTLKVRIKVGSSNSMAKNNAAIYSGLGLDNSPSSSLGNSLEDGGGIPPVFRETADESPTSILQVMTSFPVPGGALISPLHDSLLFLIRKEGLSTDSKPVPSHKGVQEHSAMTADELDSVMGNGKLLQGMKVSLVGKSERPVELKHGNGLNQEDDASFLVKRKLEENPGDKGILSNDMIQMPSNSVYVADSVKTTVRASEVSRELSKDAVRDRLFSSDSVKEDSLESISGQDSGKSEKQNAHGCLVENVWEQRVEKSSKDVLRDIGDDGRCKGNKTSAPSKAYSDISKSKEDLNNRAIALPRQKVGQKATLHVEDEINMPFGKEKPSLGTKKKLKGIQSGTKAAAVSKKESLRFGVGVAPKDAPNTSNGVSISRSNVHKLKSQKNISKVRDNHSDFSDPNLELKNNWVDPFERPSGHRPKDSSLYEFEIEKDAFLTKSKERVSGKKFDKQPISGVANGLVSEKTPQAVDPVLIEEDWVCCDSCQKWRLLPFGTKPEQLPEKWLCSMLNWLPGMNRCDINEEETTKALNALYQPPVAEGQNELQNHGNGTASAVTSAHVQHLDQNHQRLNSDAVPIRGKKKHGLKERTKSGSSSGPIQASNSTKNHLQESVKSRSLNDMNQPPAESNLMKKFSSDISSKSHKLVLEKKIPKQKEEKHMNGGNAKQIKMKNKREADQYRCESTKKSKMDDLYSADNHRNSDMDLGRMGLNSNVSLPTKASGQSMRKYNECSLSEDAKCDMKDRLLVSVKRLSDQPQASWNGGSLDMKTCDKRDSSVKKRKLKEWQDNQNGHDSEAYVKEESSESGFRKEKKSRVLKTEGKESGTKSADGRSNKKGMISQIHLSGSRVIPVDGMEEVKSINKDQQLRKHRKKIASQQTLDGVDSLRRDFGSGQVSMAATSSSSKVSGSHKTRGNFEEVKGSPVESVSSSPLRPAYPDKLASAGGDILGRDGAVNGGLPVTCNHKISGQAKPSEFGNSHLRNGDADAVEHRRCSSDLHDVEHCYNEDIVNKNHHENALFPQKFGKGSSQSKDNDRSSASDFEKDRVKVSDPVSEQGISYLKKSMRYESQVGHNNHVPHHETVRDVKCNFPIKSSIKSGKDEKNHVGWRDSAGQWSSDSRMDKQIKLKDNYDSDAKLGTLCRTNGKAAAQHKLIQDFEGESKADPETRSGMSKLFSHSEGEGKQETHVHQLLSGPQRGGVFDGLPLDASGNGDGVKASKQPGNAGNRNEVSHSLGHCTPDLHRVRDLNALSPGRMNSSSQTASNILKEAKDLREYADRLKSSGFVFESNEAYFQAALKFLHGASLLETCSSDNVRHGEITQMQAYSTTAKLCELCAHEYERRQEMAAAALVYKCMEVAYMKVVFCKHSSTSRDRNELQATLQMVPQGESPSSSASDVDNLNNQTTADKSTLSKGTVAHVTGNHVIVARNRPNFVRLLDFTQDVNFAMEASRKSQSAFAAVNVTLEETQNSECIASVKRVMDFSFQDVEGLIRLVRLAVEAISRSGFSGARD